MLICEMTAYYKTQGKTLIDVLNELYEKYGYYRCTQKGFNCEGQSGMARIKEIMTTLRENPPKSAAGLNVELIKDYGTSLATDTKTGAQTTIKLPKSNVLAYHLEGGSSLIVRPSGTEPKIKVYLEAVGSDADNANKLLEELLSAGTKLLGF